MAVGELMPPATIDSVKPDGRVAAFSETTESKADKTSRKKDRG